MCWAYDPCWTKFMYGYIKSWATGTMDHKPMGID